MEGYEIYGRYQLKPYGSKWVISALPGFFGPKLIEVPIHYPLDEVRRLAGRIAKEQGINTIVTRKDDILTLWIQKKEDY